MKSNRRKIPVLSVVAIVVFLCAISAAAMTLNGAKAPSELVETLGGGLDYEIPDKEQLIAYSDSGNEDGILLDHTDKATYLDGDGEMWSLKKGDEVTMTINIDKMNAVWGSQGEMGIGYNTDDSSFDLLKNINVIDYIQPDDQGIVTFEVPSDGNYSFTVQCFASEAFLLESVQIDILSK